MSTQKRYYGQKLHNQSIIVLILVAIFLIVFTIGGLYIQSNPSSPLLDIFGISIKILGSIFGFYYGIRVIVRREAEFHNLPTIKGFPAILIGLLSIAAVIIILLG